MENEYFASQEQQVIGALVYGIIFLVLVTTGLILFFHYSRKKITEKEIEKVSIKLNHQQKILQTTINVQERERKRIAKDLHDDISSKLNVISLTTHVLLDDDSLNNSQKDALNHILEITTNTLENSRKIAHDLMPPILDKFGIKVALEELFDEFIKSKKITIEYNIDELTNIIKSSELHIFRIIQELINNSIRHGNASKISVLLNQTHEGFTIYYSDNGTGFDVKAVKEKIGIGLQNIKSRVAILNGTFTIESSSKKGSIFKINSITNGKQ